MNCHQLPELCPEYHAGALKKSEAQSYEEHLKRCERCRLEDQEYREGLGLLEAWPIPAPSGSDAAFVANLLQKLENKSSAPRVVRLQRHRQTAAVLAWAATLALLLTLGWMDRPKGLRTDPELALAFEADFYDEGIWAELPRLEESLLEAQAPELAEAVMPLEGPELDAGELEASLWADLAQEDPSVEQLDEETEGSFGEELEELAPEQVDQLVEWFEQS